jgi:hypothetical protein
LRVSLYLRILHQYHANSAILDHALLLAEHLRDFEVLRNSIRGRAVGYFRRETADGPSPRAPLWPARRAHSLCYV